MYLRQMGGWMGVLRSRGRGYLAVAVVAGFGLWLTGCGTPGASPSTTSTTVAGHTVGGTEIDPHRDRYGAGLTSVSCPTRSSCVATDASGFIYTLARGTWSNGTLIAGGTATLNDVSCATASNCAAVGGSSDGGGWFTYALSQGSWRLDAPPGPADAGYGFGSVSCPTATFCAAVPGPGFATLSDGSWSAGPAPPTTDAPSSLALTSVSCPSRTFCVALGDDRGNDVWALTFTNGRWSVPEPLDIGGTAVVSCATTTACVAVGGGTTFSFDGMMWRSHPIPGDGPLSGVSCPTASFCVAIGGSSVYTASSGTWSTGRHLGSGLTGVSCATSTFCVAVGGGSAYVYSDGAWS